MILLELALIGIHGFNKPLRLSFKPALNLIQGNNGSGKTTLKGTLIALLSPTEDPACFHQGQAGILFRARDGKVYRLTRDFGNKAVNLSHRTDQGQFEPVYPSEDLLLKFLSEEFGGLKASELEALFCLQRTRMPSPLQADQSILRHPPSEAPTAAGIAAGMNPMPSADPPGTAADREQKEKRLEELRALLAQAEALNRMEDEVAELQSRSAELKRKIRLYQEKAKELARLDEEDPGMKKAWPLPPDYEMLLAKYEQQLVIFSEQAKRIGDDRTEIQVGLSLIPQQSVFQNRNFLTGAGLTLLSFILPVFILTEGIFQYAVLLGLVAGIGMMGMAALQDFANAQKRKTVESQLQDLTDQQETLESGLKSLAGPAQVLLERAGCRSSEEFRERVRDYERLTETKQDVEKEIGRILQGKTAEEINTELSELTGKMQELESKIRAQAGLSPDPYTLQEEMRSLERELSGAMPAGRQAAEAESPPRSETIWLEPPRSSPTVASSNPALNEPFRRILALPSLRAFLQTRTDAFQAELDRWMSRFPQTRPFHLRLDANLIPVPQTKEGKPVRLDEWNSGLLDQVYLAFFFALSRITKEAYLFPLVLDDLLGSLDASHQQIVLDILREIAQNRQVLLMSCQGYPGREGDGVLTLPVPVSY